MADFSFDLSLNFGSSASAMASRYRTTSGPTGAHLRKIGRRIATAARQQVGRDTGSLANSIFSNVSMIGGMPNVTIGATDEIALIHHEGTRPHLIEVRSRQALRFSSRGRIAYARQVMHPGTPPNKYLTDNMHLARL